MALMCCLLNLETIGKKNTETQALACPINYDFVMFTQKALKSAFQSREIVVGDDMIGSLVDGKLITDIAKCERNHLK
jgi:hypothetical protein